MPIVFVKSMKMVNKSMKQYKRSGFFKVILNLDVKRVDLFLK